MCGQMWKHTSDASKRKEKQTWSIEKPKLDNARRLRGIYFIDPRDEEFKRFMKNARRKLELPIPAAMPDKYRERCRTVEEHKTKYACIVEADESMRIRMEGVLYRYHEDHIAAKRDEFTKSLQFGAQIHSDASCNENTGCKGSSGKRRRKIGKDTVMAADKSQKQKMR